MKKMNLTMIILCCLFAMLVVLPVLTLWILSPGKPKPLLDENGKMVPNSLSEKLFLDINGSRQGMIIKSRNINNPVLLYLHGGMPDYFLTQSFPTGLEELFTIVWWDQRGSGMSFDPSIDKESITDEQLIADTVSLSNYLRERFHQDKVYLMAHSGGTFFGIQAAAQHPELFHAYIAVAQITDQLESEVLAHQYMLDQYKKMGNQKMVNKLESASISLESGISQEYLKLRDSAMHELGIGTIHEMNSILGGIFLPSWTFKEYTLSEKFNLWRAKIRNGVGVIWEKSLMTDLRQEVTKFEIPIYFLEGIYDYTCNYNLAKDYFTQIDAPVKGFYTFSQSAHSPFMEEPEKTINIFQEDILLLENQLADPFN